MTGQEVCGYLDVKIPSKGRKFGLWKAWRRQWCVLRLHRNGGEGDTLLHLAIGNSPHSGTNCGIDIPHDAVLCRSESRSRQFAFGIFSLSGCGLRCPILFLNGRSETDSQRWMMRIRNLISPPIIPVGEDEWSVSLIDNGHSRTAGLAGLYGSLHVSTTGVTVTDSATGQQCSYWQWPQLAGVAIANAEAPDDTDRILVITTSSEFSCGEGQLRLYCTERGRTLESALSAHCPYHQEYMGAKPTIRPRDSPLPPLPSLLATRRLSRSEGDLRLWSFHPPDDPFHSRTQSVSRHPRQDKVASGLISAGLGLMLSTPGCSEPDSLHDYQCLDSHWSQRERDTLPPLREFTAAYTTNRRESGVSVASGIYEEIAEQPDECYKASPSPPPLPPRLPETVVRGDDFPEEEIVYSVPNEEEEEPLYLPMSPGGGTKENAYVVMSNLINKTHISEPVV